MQDEFETVNNCFNKSIFWFHEYDFRDHIFYLDTTHIYLDKFDDVFDIIHVKVSLPKLISSLVQKNQSTDNNDTLEYYLISSPGVGTFKLFGFYMTDIRLFVHRFGKGEFKAAVNKIVEAGILSKDESKKYLRHVLTDKLYFNKKVNKPCQLIKLFYDNETKARTIILPLEPLIPIYW